MDIPFLLLTLAMVIVFFYLRNKRKKESAANILAANDFLDENKQQLTVLHNLLLLSANDLLEALQEKSPNGLQWQISKNGTDKKRWAFPNFTPVDEQQALDEEVMAKKFTWSNKWPRPAVVLSGIFWVASMLSFIGENW